VTTQSDFDAKVLQSSKPVVVKFFATWCGSCKKMKPIVDSIAAEYGSSYDFIEVDVDKASAVADRYNIKNLPTIIFFKNGKQLGSAIGDSSRASLVASMQKALG
jgi:thioredoxin 1